MFCVAVATVAAAPAFITASAGGLAVALFAVVRVAYSYLLGERSLVEPQAFTCSRCRLDLMFAIRACSYGHHLIRTRTNDVFDRQSWAVCTTPGHSTTAFCFLGYLFVFFLAVSGLLSPMGDGS